MKPAHAPKITIDTNCVVGLFDTKSQTATSTAELQALMRYALSSVIELSITTRVEVDFGRDDDIQRREEILQQIRMFPIIGTVAQFDVSMLDGGDVAVRSKHHHLTKEVQRIVSPGLTPTNKRFANKVGDIEHLAAHKLNGRDVFVTDDKGILRCFVQLRDAVGILVMNPTDCLKFVDDHHSRQQTKSLVPASDDAAYRDMRLMGTVTFDYSNNDHRFAIGEGLFLFETEWSKASDKSIYAYRHRPSIEALALAKGASEIGDVTDATVLDFSSHARTPHLGQIVIWRNVNGLYAATKIVAICDDSRGAAYDELTFDFVILPDGATNFSK
jgi:hypothetical protein